jgi:hypothetical protein
MADLPAHSAGELGSPADGSALFPLPLVAFEQYMFTDDRPDYPTDFFLRLDFAGVFERPALDAAVDATLRRHPLLRAWVRASGRERFEWVPAEHCMPLIRWQVQGEPRCGAIAPRIDLRRETGLRIFIDQQENRSEMLLQFQHACCDAFGALRFVEDLLATYHNALAGSSQQICLPTLDVRGNFGLNPLKYLLRAHKELAGALGVVEYFVLRPVPLVPREGGSSEEIVQAERPASSAHTFTVSETERLRQTTKQLGCTVNDLLLRDLFLAIRAWMLQHDPDSEARWCRIMIPTNLRTPADASMPAANVVGMVFNDRRPRKLLSPRRLMKLLRTEMRFCKRWRLGLSMIHVIRLARRFRGGLPRLLRADRCLATAVLSNLGNLGGETVLPRRDGRMVAANVTLERVELLPPLRPKTHASFGAVSYAGRLTVTLTYDLRYFTRQGGRQLLDGFVQQIHTSLNHAD